MIVSIHETGDGMKRVLAGAALAAAMSAPLQAQEWTGAQLALAAAGTALHIVDWGQTRHIAVSQGAYSERAPVTRMVVGEHPSTGRVDAYMLGTGALFLLAAHLLPESRTAILATWAATRLAVVINNDRIGLSFHGSF